MIGIICSFSAFLVGIIQVFLKLFYPENYQYGISTIVVVVAFISGVQMIGLGIL